MKLKPTAAAAAIALSMIGLGATSQHAAADIGISFGIHGPGIYAPVYGIAPYYAAPYVYAPAPRYRYRTWRRARPHRVRRCRPIYAKRRVHRVGRGWTRARVKVGSRCKTVWR